MQGTKIGTYVRMSAQKDERKTKIVMKKMRYVTGIFYYLLSKTQATKNGFEVRGKQNWFILKFDTILIEQFKVKRNTFRTDYRSHKRTNEEST